MDFNNEHLLQQAEELAKSRYGIYLKNLIAKES
jgi:hypothetical protein